MNPLTVNRLTPLMDFYFSLGDSAFFTECLQLANNAKLLYPAKSSNSVGFQSPRTAEIHSLKVKEVKSGLPK